MKALFAFAFLLCISVAFGIKCYTCSSTTSMDDCDKNKKETDCGAAGDRCSKMTLEYSSIKSYIKGCNLKAVCDAEGSSLTKACKDAGGTCEFSCCEGDLCNSGAAPMISVLLMVACALVAFFR